MLTCKEVTKLVASGELDDASATQRSLARLHLLLCGDCRRYVEELRALRLTARDVLRSELDTASLAALERRIIALSQSADRSADSSVTGVETD